jgi:hypothetical protein
MLSTLNVLYRYYPYRGPLRFNVPTSSGDLHGYGDTIQFVDTIKMYIRQQPYYITIEMAILHDDLTWSRAICIITRNSLM